MGSTRGRIGFRVRGADAFATPGGFWRVSGRFLRAWGLIVLGGGLGTLPDAWLGDTRLQADETATADSVQWLEALEYSRPDGTSLQLNLARPAKLNAPAPAVLCIHGGGFRAGKRDRWNTTCKQLAERGYVAATVTYRLAPAHPYPAAVHDVKAAVRWLRAHAGQHGIDPERIGVLGDSAGGHLAQYLGVTGDVPTLEGNGGSAGHSSRVTCVVNYYGPSDLTRSYGRSVDAGEVLPLWLGGDAYQQRHRHILASPLYWVSPTSAPTLLIHGTRDPYVHFEQAVWIYERMQTADVAVELLTLENAGHGFQGEDAQRAEQATFEFLDRNLKSKAAAAQPSQN
jgi:acetyl esterase/lipase